MTAGLECVPIHEPSWVMLRVAGELNLSSAPRLRVAALKCLAEQPGALILDAERLTVAGDIHLTVLLALARHAAAWPSIPVLLCAPQPDVAAGLARLGIDRHVTVCADVRAGRTLAARQELPPSVRDELFPVVDSARLARRLVEDACEQWRLTHLASAAGVVVTELVANAVRHADTRIDLIATRRSRHLHLAVRDYVRRPARLVGPSRVDQSAGRGLIIVEAFTASWGCTPTQDGKVTWASLRIG